MGTILDEGLPGETLVEPCVAATPDLRMVVCKSGSGLRRCFQVNQASNWRFGTMPQAVYPLTCSSGSCEEGGCGEQQTFTSGWVDPSVVNIRQDGSPSALFLALTEVGERVAIARFTAPETGFTPWCTINDPVTTNPDVDKPWIVAGSDGEAYAVFMKTGGGNRYIFGRSSDSGISWAFQNLQVGTATPAGNFCAHPAVADSGGCYVAISESTGLESALVSIVRFHDSTSTFEWLMASETSIFSIAQNNVQILNYVKGDYKSASVPYLTGSTIDSNTLFLLRADTASVGNSNVDVVRSRIQYSSTLGTWSETAAWQLRSPTGNDQDPDTVMPDQFCPASVIDQFGQLHIIFYDNASTRNAASQLTADYDVWHAVIPRPYASTSSQFGTVVYSNLRTSALPQQEPALTLSLLPTNGANNTPREYPGISCYYDATLGRVVVWCAYVGTSSLDPDSDKTVLYGSRVTVKPPE